MAFLTNPRTPCAVPFVDVADDEAEGSDVADGSVDVGDDSVGAVGGSVDVADPSIDSEESGSNSSPNKIPSPLTLSPSSSHPQSSSRGVKLPGTPVLF